MRVCIVGGSGNISTSMVRAFTAQGHAVTVFNRGARAEQSGEQQRSLRLHGARQITGDRDDPVAFEQTMQRERFDAVVHMICFDRGQAESAVRAFRGVKHFVQCSTVATFDVLACRTLPIDEEAPLQYGDDPYSYGGYGRDKVAADQV
jgi:nucleoside-diphosphate-sugar epimerase